MKTREGLKTRRKLGMRGMPDEDERRTKDETEVGDERSVGRGK